MIGTDKNDSLNQILTNLQKALGEPDPNLPSGKGLLAALSPVWDGYASYAATGSYLQYAFTARQAIDNVLSGVWSLSDFSQAEVSDKLSQKFGQLHVMRDDLTTEINRLLAASRASFLPVSSVMGQGQLGTAPSPGQPQTLSLWGFPLGDFGTVTPVCPFGRFGW